MREDFVEITGYDSDMPFCISLAGISYCDASYKVSRKKSDCYCLEYIISGTGTVEVGDKIYHPAEGDVYLLHLGERHCYYSDPINPWVKIWINFSGSLADGLIESYGLKDKTLFHFDGYKYIKDIHEVLEDKSLNNSDSMNRAALYLHEFLQKLSRTAKETEGPTGEAEIMKEMIEESIFIPISTEVLASRIYKSPSQAIRIFKKKYGMTPYDYYINIRIKKAVSLLKNTRLTVKEIAYMLCFCDEHYFSNLFKKKTGKSPREYRKQDA